MNLNVTLDCLRAIWRTYLQEQGHHVYKTRRGARVIRSRSGNQIRYRWLLLAGQAPERILTKSEQSNIRQHLRQAKARKEMIYLVVGFTKEPRRIIVIPARTVLKSRRVYSDKGGICLD